MLFHIYTKLLASERYVDYLDYFAYSKMQLFFISSGITYS